MSPSYAERCIKKANILLREVLDDYALGHIHKTIVGFWEIIELLLRAIIHKKRKTTYEKPRKLINEYLKVVTTPKGTATKINLLYELRKKTVHKPLILPNKSVESAKEAFCGAIYQLIKVLPMSVTEITENIDKLCRKRTN